MSEEKGKKYKVVLECMEIRGSCPIYKEGDRVVINEPIIDTRNSVSSGRYQIPNAICYPMILDFGFYYRPICRGVSLRELGLAKEEGDEGYFSCHAPDLGESPKAHGTIIWKVKRIPIKKSLTDEFIEYLTKHGLPGGK